MPATPATPRRRGRPADHSSDDTRAAILATAQRLFGASGFKGVSMDRLAAEAGLTVRALYHYYPSKRALFAAATHEAMARFGEEVAARVFVHPDLRSRARAYVDVYRALHERDPHLLSFVGMVLVEAISSDVAAGGQGTSAASAELDGASAALRVFLQVLVDDAFANGEVHPDLDPAGALMLLNTLGMGLALAALDREGHFAAMLDAMDRLVDGSLWA